MITSVFKKSTPINYSLMIILVLSSFFLYQIKAIHEPNSPIVLAKKAGTLILIFGSFFLSNFIVKKNALTKDSSYTILFYFVLMLFFPPIWYNMPLIVSNFFILLAMRRLVSLQTLKMPKEKIFDATLWILMASLFQFWTVLFIILVYISILFHVSRDYRNWFLPIIAFFTWAVLLEWYSLLLDPSAVATYLDSSKIYLNLDYFTNNYQNIALSIYAVFMVFFLTSALFSVTSKPLNLQASYKKVLFAFVIGMVIYILSPNKSNEVLVFTFFPLAVMASNAIEYNQIKWKKEVMLALAIVLGLISFGIQL